MIWTHFHQATTKQFINSKKKFNNNTRRLQVGYTLSNAEKLSSPACGTIPYAGDEESPLCSRLSITGNFLNISGTDEEQTATDALFGG